MHYVLKDLLIDTEARTVRRNDTTVKLPDLSFDVLVKLIKTAPESVSITEFCNDVWQSGHVSDETVAQRITLLRKALGDNPKTPTYIRTIRGLGYVIQGNVSIVASEPLQKVGLVQGHRKKIAVIIGCMTLLFTAVLISNVWNANSEPVEVAVNQNSSVGLLIERARQQLRLHQALETNRAIAMLREALTQEPERFDGRLTLSFALSTKTTKFGGSIEEEQEAEALARSLISEQPDSSNAWSALAYSLSSQGRADESLPAYQYAYQLDPYNASAISSAAHLHLIRGEFHQALLLEMKAKQAGGKSRYAEIQIAQTLELINHPAAADWRARALSLNPGQVVILSEIARWHLRQGKPHAALETLAQAIGDGQSAPQILQLRSRATIMLGNLTQAHRLLEATGDYGKFDLALLEATAGATTSAKALLLAKLEELDSDVSPEYRIKLAELSAVIGLESEALKLIVQAVNLGWRDTNWLKQSPYVGALMLSPEGLDIQTRITREVDAQRRLIQGSEELVTLIGG
jgi:DNA-binding winged helix-turn-helix (wHTH) protein/Flp pilus assembly protein TadD